MAGSSEEGGAHAGPALVPGRSAPPDLGEQRHGRTSSGAATPGHDGATAWPGRCSGRWQPWRASSGLGKQRPWQVTARSGRWRPWRASSSSGRLRPQRESTGSGKLAAARGRPALGELCGGVGMGSAGALLCGGALLEERGKKMEGWLTARSHV